MADAGEGGPLLPLLDASCLFYLGKYEEAREAALHGPDVPLRVRLLFHISQKLGEEDSVVKYHKKLRSSKTDKLSLAAMHFSRGHYQEATDEYKKIFLDHRDDLALNVYIAMCYYKLDYYDVSMEILSVYLQNFPQSATALNLKACNNYKVYNGKAAEADLLPAQDAGLDLSSHPLIQHNLVVFRDGENALRVLPGLVDAVPEARMNLIIYHLRQGDLEAAQELAQGLDSLSPQATILKAVVHALVGQATRSQPELKQAQKLFQLVGSSATECDTIPGRQCMASCLYLLRQWADVNVYLDSIKQYMYNDDDFNWTYGISLAAEGRFAEAEETLQLVRSEMYTSNFTYLSWLVRCLIANGKAREAWELYVKLDTSPDALNLLQLIANDCYRMGAFFYAAKAFDVLERLEADPEYWEGKRGACIGVFQAVIAGKESPEALKEVVSILRGTSNPQVEYIIRQMAQWATGAGIRL